MSLLAALTNPALNPSVGNLSDSAGGSGILQMFISNLITTAFIGGSLIFFIMILWGGYELITSGGDKDAVERARKRLTHAIIGICLLFSIYALVFVIGSLFGINFRTLNIPIIGSGTGNTSGVGGGTGNSNCGCYNGGCAATGTIAPITLGGACARCTPTGWTSVSGSCSPIVCVSCP